MPVAPRCGGGLGTLMISSIWTNIFADSGDGPLLRQSESAVVFLAITRDARSASPPLCKPVRYMTTQIESPRRRPYLVYRISLPMPPTFRGLTSKPLRTAFSIRVAYRAPSCSKVNPNRSALPPSVHKSVARAIRVLDTGFDRREGPCDGDRNLDRSGSARLLGGVDGRGGGLKSLGGLNILVEFEGCGTGTGTGTGGGGGERIRVKSTAGAFSFGTSASRAERERRESFWGRQSRSTT
jgi:hypothetical protein